MEKRVRAITVTGLIILAALFCFSQKEYDSKNTQIEKSENNKEETYIKFEQLYENIVTNLAENIRIISFQINVQYTSFVKNNNNSINSIVFCEDEECQKYGYYKIRKNWFIRISPRPE